MQSLDIMREYEDGSRRWVEAATDVDDAKARIRSLEGQTPGVYVIFNHRTQQMISLVDARGTATSAARLAAQTAASS
jgi:hypothetical protein